MLSERLKFLRREKGITQLELADILKTSRTTVASYEQGVSEPGIDMIKKMIDYFGVTVEYLVGLSPYKNFNEQIKIGHIEIDKNLIISLKKEEQNFINELLRSIINTYLDILITKPEASENCDLILNLDIMQNYFSEFIIHFKSILKRLKTIKKEEDQYSEFTLCKTRTKYLINILIKSLDCLKEILENN